MKSKFLLLTTIILTWQLNITYAQDWPTAPEIWSEPVLLDSLFNIPYHWLESPSLTQGMDTLYYFDSRINMPHKKDGKWTLPVQLTDNVNGFSAMRECSISKDGKKLYMCAWGGYGGWDVYYLNINTKTVPWQNSTKRSGEYLPRISRDGKTMIILK